VSDVQDFCFLNGRGIVLLGFRGYGFFGKVM